MSTHTRHLILGIDTGGTFTDAVIADTTGAVIASAKAPTTHHELAVGIGTAVDKVLAVVATSDTAERIGVVSVSTTLATNAIVEDGGRPAVLIAVGLESEQLAAAGLDSQMASGDQLILVPGGHDAQGGLLRPVGEVIDDVLAALNRKDLAALPRGVAIASQFSVRNPETELAVRDALVDRIPGVAVTCSHGLSSRLGGPRRALTAMLNARLIGIIGELLDAVSEALEQRSVHARLMVVRGDGSVVSAEVAAERPVETILSGPAASVNGALHLSGETDAVICDVGGTTTDVAVAVCGRVRPAPDGALVAGLRTMVDAVEIHTSGLGGDSEVRVDGRDVAAPLIIGPRRAIPVSRIARERPEEMAALLSEAQRSLTLSPSEIRFVVPTKNERPPWLTDRLHVELLDRLGSSILSEHKLATTATTRRALDRLVGHGLVRIATLTPTDALHVAGKGWGLDTEAAVAITELAAARQRPNGARIAANASELAEMILEQIADGSARAVLGAALADAGIAEHEAFGPIANRALAEQAGSATASVDEPGSGVLRARLGLNCPLVGVGASSAVFHRRAGELLDSHTVIPELAPVANAVGAAIAKVAVKRVATITQPRRGKFVVHLDEQPAVGSVEAARAIAVERLTPAVRDDAARAGADDALAITESWKETTAIVEGRPWFIEGTLAIHGVGDPVAGESHQGNRDHMPRPGPRPTH